MGLRSVEKRKNFKLDETQQGDTVTAPHIALDNIMLSSRFCSMAVGSDRRLLNGLKHRVPGRFRSNSDTYQPSTNKFKSPSGNQSKPCGSD
jgi:hypothetical protein